MPGFTKYLYHDLEVHIYPPPLKDIFYNYAFELFWK